MNRMKFFMVHWNSVGAPIWIDKKLKMFFESGEREITIKVWHDDKCYPNTCVPIAAIIEYYREKGMEIHFSYEMKNGKNYIKHTMVETPLLVEEHLEDAEIKFPMDKVWKYSTPEGESNLVNEYIRTLREFDVLSEGVLESAEWCMNEIMDNVLVHSQAKCGYVMGQIHRQKKKISVCVFDRGVGIYNTLKNSKHIPRKALDAITLALQEKVTRDERVGQGNGMWGMGELIRANEGIFRVVSNGALYMFRDNEVSLEDNFELKVGGSNQATLIEFQIDYSHDIDVVKALKGRELVDDWLSNKELAEGELLFMVKNDSPGTGTRVAAERFRNMITNSLLQNNQRIVLDFEGVNIVSSSYADELIGKLIAKKGLVYFMNHFNLINLSPTNIGVINRSVEQRMGHMYYETTIIDEV